eukprot:6838303-Prymnesium_polylepis.1
MRSGDMYAAVPTHEARRENCGARHATCDMWHVTRDMWTRDMWHVTPRVAPTRRGASTVGPTWHPHDGHALPSGQATLRRRRRFGARGGAWPVGGCSPSAAARWAGSPPSPPAPWISLRTVDASWPLMPKSASLISPA